MESSAIDQTGPGSSKPAVPLIVPQNNPFVTGNAGAAVDPGVDHAARRPGTLIVTKLLTPFGNRVETFKYDVWQALVGVKGDIPGTRLNYDVYATLGHSQFVNTGAGDASRTAITSDPEWHRELHRHGGQLQRLCLEPAWQQPADRRMPASMPGAPITASTR